MLKNTVEEINGIIDDTDNKLVFHNDGYRFTLLANDFKIQEKLSKRSIPDGFIYGKTYFGNRIGIHTGALEYSPTPLFRVFTDLYLEAEFSYEGIDVQHFHSICFVGGILNQLRIKRSFGYNADDEIVEYEFRVKDEKCTISTGFFSNGTATETTGSHNFDTFLRLTFDREQTVSSLMQHYKNVNLLISFLTHRTQNYYDCVFITPSFEDKDWIFKRVFVHFKDSDDAKLKFEQKPCIKFDDIGKGIAKLLELVYNRKKKKPSISLGFIPQDESERWVVTDNTVRSVCTALECEVSLRKKQIGKPQRTELLLLCEELRRKIKDHEKKYNGTPTALSEGTYAMMQGSINNWAMSATEQFCKLFQLFTDEMAVFHRGLRPVNENDIHSLVVYRNTITHGSYNEMPSEVRRAVYTMKALVYCSLLDRIDVSREKIKYLCDFHFDF